VVCAAPITIGLVGNAEFGGVQHVSSLLPL
jgi:hypothetical protein